MRDHPTFIQKLRILVFGFTEAHETIMQEGWSAPMELYWFRCPIHGYQKSRTHGYGEWLYCPECRSKVTTIE